MIRIKIKKNHELARIPEVATKGDAGMDLFSVQDTFINPGEFTLIDTGISIELPKNTEAQVRPRSGLALKYGITVLNTPGTIDEGYRGNIGVILINHGKNIFHIEPQMKIAQLIIKPIYEVEIAKVEILSNSDRNEKGFGSSGI